MEIILDVAAGSRGNIQQTSYISWTGQHSLFKLMLFHLGKGKTVSYLEVHASLITWNCPIQTPQFLTNNGFPNSSNLIHASAQNHSSVVTCNGCCMNHLDTCFGCYTCCWYMFCSSPQEALPFLYQKYMEVLPTLDGMCFPLLFIFSLCVCWTFVRMSWKWSGVHCLVVALLIGVWSEKWGGPNEITFIHSMVISSRIC